LWACTPITRVFGPDVADPRLREMKAFLRMGSAAELDRVGWNGDGTGTGGSTGERLAELPGMIRDGNGGLRFADWGCRAGENNVIIRTDGTVAPCFPMYSATYDWGNIDGHKFEREQLREMKRTCQSHCFSTIAVQNSAADSRRLTAA
jgi:hypothetical protein